MKKLFVSVLAIAAMVACSNEEIISFDKGEAINFNAPFISNSTREAVDGSYSGTKEFNKFNVYGTVTGIVDGVSNTINLFGGDANAIVTGSIGDAAWSCDETEYWVPNCTYNFIAIADATSVSPAKAMPTTITYNDSADGDLILATAQDSTNEFAVPAKGNPVNLTFTHLLSKVKFTFSKKAYANSLYTYAVKNIKFTNAYTSGDYTINSGVWGSLDNKGEVVVGDLEGNLTKSNSVAGLESAKERLIIPATYSASNQLVVSFDVVTMYGSGDTAKAISSVTYTKKFPSTGEYTFVKSTAYNFGVELDENNAIEFKVTSAPTWTSNTGGDLELK